MFTPKDHDLSLSDWGPYSKCYAGASHIADKKRGLRFDLSVFPALYRRRVDVPNVTWESDWHPWECAPDFTYFSTRHELVWKDQVYMDAAWFRPAPEDQPDGDGLFVRCEFVNNTARPVSAALHSMASMNFPTLSNYSDESLHRIHVEWENSKEAKTGGAVVKHPLDYESLDFARQTPANHLMPDGFYRGEVRGNGFMDGSGLGGFARNAGASACYVFTLNAAMRDARFIIRLRGSGCFCLKKNGINNHEKKIGVLKSGHGRFENIECWLGLLQAGRHVFTLESLGGEGDEEIAFLALAPAAAGDVRVREAGWSHQPSCVPYDDAKAGQILKYPDVSQHYGIAWDAKQFETRRILNKELDCFLRHNVHDHVHETLQGDTAGHFSNIFIRPLVLAPRSRIVLRGLAWKGAPAQIKRTFATFFEGAPEKRAERFEFAHARARRSVFSFRPNPGGKHFAFSQDRMAATTLSNAVFPVYTQRQYVRHRPPGRWWNSLYTWDSGFIGLGLLEIDPRQAEENLAQYLTSPGNPHAAFIQHGSMVPMQIHLAHELWNRLGAESPEGEKSIRMHYDSLRRYYRFLSGDGDGSTLRSLKSGLLRPWDYFYNSGGWDDYPPQRYVHEKKQEASVSPVITTALAIRCARTLGFAAGALGLKDDVSGYENDIRFFSSALEEHSWDESAGVYSYVLHDRNGRPLRALYHEPDGANFNMGLDGLFPLVAGICNARKQRRLVAQLFSPSRFWTPVGLSAVDRSAPYYRNDGYWNGSVWFPHQWFFWKTMLDLGRPARAFAIAGRALKTWDTEVRESYHCFEHFLIETGRGCGWHQFSGLSTPVMIFYAACHCPGRLTTGFDAWVASVGFNKKNTRMNASIKFRPCPISGRRSLLVCMKSGHNYHAEWNGKKIAFDELIPGLLAISLPTSECEGTLTIDSG
ncbi:hypothetical protein AW736_05090 [Termitidicoccus mucosus]|uniref:Mannosylglycerate hydrolase MGH1-like glycoside hydrolase domain-containing protein n=1 Tax=Termitidicoccus mucosus TaxID=1184151 RepID=A0A178IM82_9BACT|nr:hypothetical protein AW736_05090 [Opitutaceae bacterium TSB47]